MYMNIVLLSNSIQKMIYICMNELGIILKIVHNVFSFCIGSTFFQQGKMQNMTSLEMSW